MISQKKEKVYFENNDGGKSCKSLLGLFASFLIVDKDVSSFMGERVLTDPNFTFRALIT
jgi:hypothetical protein